MQKNENKRNRKIKLASRVTKETYDELVALLNGTHFQNLNELCRHIIAGKRVVATFRDGPPDKLLADLTMSYMKLQRDCSEIDQLTKMIHGEQSPEGLVMLAMATRHIFTEVNELLGPMQALMTSISERWIPEEEPGS